MPGSLSDDEEDVLTTFHVYTPTPGDEPLGATTHPMEPGSAKGSVSLLGSSMDTLYTGVGFHTHGHVFIDGRGTVRTGEPQSWMNIPSFSRMTFQSTGQAVVQSIYQPLYLLAGDSAVLAANNDAFVTSNSSVHVVAGWAGTTSDGVSGGETSVDPGPNDGQDGNDAPKSPLLGSYVNGLNTQARWTTLASSLNTTLDLIQAIVGDTADTSDDESARPTGLAATLRGIFTSTMGAVASAVGGAMSVQSAMQPLPLRAGPNDNPTTPAPPIPTGRSIVDLLANKISLSSSGGIQGATPAAVSFMAGISASLTGAIAASVSSLGVASLVGGASAKVSSLVSTAILSRKKVRITSGGEVQIQARSGDIGIRGKRVQLGFARSASESTQGPTDVSGTGNLDQAIADMGDMTAGINALVASLSGSTDPLVATTAGLYTAAATAAVVDAGVTAVQRAALRASLTPAGAAVSKLDGHMPDFEPGAGGSETAHVLPATGESVYQQETEDVLVKASQKIRLKAHEGVQIGGGGSASIFAGDMVIHIVHTEAGDTITLGAMGASDDVSSASGPSITYPKIQLKKTGSSTFAISVATADDVKFEIDTTNDITMQSGSSHIKIENSGSVEVVGTKLRVNHNFEVG